MATPRRPLAEIPGNPVRGAELTPYTRGKIIGYHQGGEKPPTIARRLNVSVSTVRYTILHGDIRPDGKSLQRTGRPKSYTEAEARLILRHVRLNPKDTHDEVKRACGLACSRNTLKRILKEHGITNWRCKKRSFLIEKVVD